MDPITRPVSPCLCRTGLPLSPLVVYRRYGHRVRTHTGLPQRRRLASSGLLLAWYAIRARYGDIDVRSLGGVAYPMPRFSTLLALLALAALGMPPFGVFTGLVGMLLSPEFAPSGVCCHHGRLAPRILVLHGTGPMVGLRPPTSGSSV